MFANFLETDSYYLRSVTAVSVFRATTFPRLIASNNFTCTSSLITLLLDRHEEHLTRNRGLD